MKGSELFPGKYLRHEDLGTSRPVVTIKKVTVETVGDDQKPVLYFAGKEKGLVCNKTNWNMVVELTGEDDSDNWVGKKIRLYVAKVDFQGKRVPAIRITGTDEVVEEAPRKASPAKSRKREPEPTEPAFSKASPIDDDANFADAPDDDEIPF